MDNLTVPHLTYYEVKDEKAKPFDYASSPRRISFFKSETSNIHNPADQPFRHKGKQAMTALAKVTQTKYMETLLGSPLHGSFYKTDRYPIVTFFSLTDYHVPKLSGSSSEQLQMREVIWEDITNGYSLFLALVTIRFQSCAHYKTDKCFPVKGEFFTPQYLHRGTGKVLLRQIFDDGYLMFPLLEAAFEWKHLKNGQKAKVYSTWIHNLDAFNVQFGGLSDYPSYRVHKKAKVEFNSEFLLIDFTKCTTQGGVGAKTERGRTDMEEASASWLKSFPITTQVILASLAALILGILYALLN